MLAACEASTGRPHAWASMAALGAASFVEGGQDHHVGRMVERQHVRNRAQEANLLGELPAPDQPARRPRAYTGSRSRPASREPRPRRQPPLLAPQVVQRPQQAQLVLLHADPSRQEQDWIGIAQAPALAGRLPLPGLCRAKASEVHEVGDDLNLVRGHARPGDELALHPD